MVKNGIDALTICLNAGMGKDFSLYVKAGVLRIRYAELYRRTGVSLLKSGLEQMKQENHDSKETERLQKLVESYEKTVGDK